MLFMVGMIVVDHVLTALLSGFVVGLQLNAFFERNYFTAKRITSSIIVYNEFLNRRTKGIERERERETEPFALKY